MQVVTRDQWGARSADVVWAPLDRGIVFHWNGPALGNYSEAGTFQVVRNTQNFHMDSRGWRDIAYNFAISRWGHIIEGRGDFNWNAASGANEPNYRYLAVEFMCGEGEPFNDAMKHAASELVQWYVSTGRPLNLTVHRDWVATACPGEEITDFVHWSLADFAPQAQQPQIIVPVPETPVFRTPIVPRFLLQQGVDMYVHHPVMRSETHNGKFVYDFTYVPANGAILGNNAVKSAAVCIRHDKMTGGEQVTLFHGNGAVVAQHTLNAGTNVYFVEASGAFSIVSDSGDLQCQIREETIYSY